MKRMVVLCAVLAVGCASYVAPTGPDVAQLKGKFVRQGTFEWEKYEVRFIDGEPVQGAFAGPGIDAIRVTPGIRRVVVQGSYTYPRPFFKGMAEVRAAFFVLEADIRPGREYQATGALSQHFMEVWIEETATAQPVTLRVACQPRPESIKMELQRLWCSKPLP